MQQGAPLDNTDNNKLELTDSDGEKVHRNKAKNARWSQMIPVNFKYEPWIW